MKYESKHEIDRDKVSCNPTQRVTLLMGLIVNSFSCNFRNVVNRNGFRGGVEFTKIIEEMEGMIDLMVSMIDLILIMIAVMMIMMEVKV